MLMKYQNNTITLWRQDHLIIWKLVFIFVIKNTFATEIEDSDIVTDSEKYSFAFESLRRSMSVSDLVNYVIKEH